MEKELSLYCIKYAESVLPENMAFHGGSPKKQIPISFAIYFIKTDKKNILVDAGCETMPGFKMENFYSPVAVLSQVGLSADDITDVIITHSHHDHVEAVKYFKNAVIHINEAEYQEAEKYIPAEFKINLLNDEYNLTPQIKVIKCGGHSKGSAIVEIITEDSIRILAGDECYTNANIENKICTGAFYNKEKAIDFVKKYSDTKYRVHTCHDSSIKTERII